MSTLDLITPAEDAFFRQNGYLLLPSAVSQPEVATLLAEVTRLAGEAHELGAVLPEEHYVSNENSYRLFRILRLSEQFDGLVDHRGYFGKLVSLIGTHIQLMGAEIFVRGESIPSITNFHTDMGPGFQQILPAPDNAFIQIKMQIFLTDLSEPDASNFVVVPGSHLVRVTDSDDYCKVNAINREFGPNGEFPPAAKQIMARPGDVILFTHSLWHAVAPNRSGRIRYSISLRYGQLGLRPFERFDPVLNDPGRKLTLRQRRVLGDLGNDSPGAYRPLDQQAIIHGLRTAG